MAVHSLSHVQLSATPWTAACQASLSITKSWSLLKFMSTESVMPSSHPILCRPLPLLPSIFPSIRVVKFHFFLRRGESQRESAWDSRKVGEASWGGVGSQAGQLQHPWKGTEGRPCPAQERHPLGPEGGGRGRRQPRIGTSGSMVLPVAPCLQEALRK